MSNYKIGVRNKQVIKRISELLAIGLTNNQIAEQVSKELKMELSESVVKNIVKKQSVRKKEFLESDNKFAEIYRSSILNLINKSQDNLHILEEIREILMDKLSKIKETSDEEKISAYINQVSMAIRTQNDSIRTYNELLKRMESEAKEVEVSIVESVGQTLNIIKQLEDEGLITINPEYYKSEIYKAHQKQKQENEKEEI